MPLAHMSFRRQTGATLIVALVFLIILTAAGITAVRLATDGEKMAGSNQFRNTAFQLAQTELRSHLLRFGSVANRGPLLVAMDASLANATTEPDSTLRARYPDLRIFLNLTALTSQTGLTQANTYRSLGARDCAVFGDGYSFDNYTCRQYEIKARSELAEGTYSDQTQGFVFFNLK